MNKINRTYGGNASGSILRIVFGISLLAIFLSAGLGNAQGAMKGDSNNNGVSADAGDLVLIKRASIGEIPADSSYDLNNNGIQADAGDLVLMKRASIGEQLLDIADEWPSPVVSPTVTSTPTRTLTSISSTQHKPVFIYPVDGVTLDYEGSYLFKVESIANTQEFLWGFFQNGEMVWENYRDEKTLSSNEYEIRPGTIAHSKFIPGKVEVWVRALIDGQWTDAATITVYLQSTTPTVSITANPDTHDINVSTNFTFTANPAGSWGNNIEYSWSVGYKKCFTAAVVFTGQNISPYVSAECGNATISVIAEDEKNNSANDTYSVTVHENATPPPLKKFVGPEGGIIEGENLSVLVPEGAFTKPTEVSITRPPAGLVSPPIEEILDLIEIANLNIKGDAPLKPVDIAMPAPAGVSSDDQFLVAELIDVEGVKKLKLVDLADVVDNKLVSQKVIFPFDFPQIFKSGFYLFLTPKATKNPQNAIGYVRGRVVDQDNKPVPGAIITISQLQTFADKTNANGEYLIPSIVGSFAVTAFDPKTGNFKTVGGAVPNKGGGVTIDIVLQPHKLPLQPALINGGFDDNLDNWEHEGQVIILNSPLGSLSPQQGAGMVLMTTGSKSVNQAFSTLKQRFTLPAGSKKITFQYNFITREYTEYIGSKYNDVFESNILTKSGTIPFKNGFMEVNKKEANFQGIDVSFPDENAGDSTMGHTGWMTAEAEVDKTAGDVVLSFSISDVGDTVYDSGVLIDDIKVVLDSGTEVPFITKCSDAPFIFPVPSVDISGKNSYIGWLYKESTWINDPNNPNGGYYIDDSQYHSGLDFWISTGTPVMAQATGYVSRPPTKMNSARGEQSWRVNIAYPDIPNSKGSKGAEVYTNNLINLPDWMNPENTAYKWDKDKQRVVGDIKTGDVIGHAGSYEGHIHWSVGPYTPYPKGYNDQALIRDPKLYPDFDAIQLDPTFYLTPKGNLNYATEVPENRKASLSWWCTGGQGK